MPDPTTTAALQEILDRFLAGDPSAKAALVDRAYDRLLLVARGHLKKFPKVRRDEETAAILNMAYHKISKALDDVRPATVRLFFGLAALQIRRVLLDMVGGPPRPGPLEGDLAGGNQGPDEFGWRTDVLTALEKLPEDEQELVGLLFYMGLTQSEAAVILGVHEDTVKRRWARVKIKLADFLAAYRGSE
jgi:hypothetical protein